MTTREFIKLLIRFLRPRFYNRLTWLIVVFSFGLISKPIFLDIVNAILKKQYDINIISENDPLIGVILIIAALLYNSLINISHTCLTKPRPSNINSNVIHDSHGTVVQNNYNFNITVANEAQQTALLDTIKKTTDTTNFNSLQGLSTQTNFLNLFGELPWVSSIQCLSYDKTKTYSLIDISEPTYSIKYSVGNKEFNNIITQVFSTSDTELNINQVFKSNQIDQNYLIAVYWEKFRVWTLNSIYNFTDSERLNISFDEAIKNDLMTILGDYTFISDNIQLKIMYDSTYKGADRARHAEYGTIENAYLLRDSKEIELTMLEMSIVDSLVKTEVISKTEQAGKITVIEANTHNVIIKLSTLVQVILAYYDRELKPIEIKLAITVIQELLIGKVDALISQQIPAKPTKQSDHLYELSFKGTKTLENYKNTAANNR